MTLPPTKTEYDKTHFNIGGNIDSIKKPRTVFTKGRSEVYSKDVYKIIKRKLVIYIYTISAPLLEGRREYSYNILLKVHLNKGELDKQLKETKKKEYIRRKR